MLKRKNYKKIKGKNLEESQKSFDIQNKKVKMPDMVEEINKAAEGLYYISETDARILPFIGGQTEAVTREEILEQTKSAIDSPVEERDFVEFFARLTEIQDWFGDEEKETAQKFMRLKELLEKSLKELKVFKIGKIQLDVYIVGLNNKGELTGIKTKAVET
jgi:hypothetical protein